MSPDGKQGLRVKAIDPNQSMLWEGKNTTWAWRLDKLDEKHTRLVTRVRMHYDLMSPWVIFDLVFDPGDFVMMRKMLLGIKRRAEASASNKPSRHLQHAPRKGDSAATSKGDTIAATSAAGDRWLT
jgi:hypothetical protein